MEPKYLSLTIQLGDQVSVFKVICERENFEEIAADDALKNITAKMVDKFIKDYRNRSASEIVIDKAKN